MATSRIILNASHDSPMAAPVEVPGGLEGLPTFEEIPTDEVAETKPDGSPVFKTKKVPVGYYWKEIARVPDQTKNWVHRSQVNQFSGEPEQFTFTPQSFDQTISNFNDRVKAGIKPFLPDTHVERRNAAANNGEVLALERRGGSLHAKLKVVGSAGIEKLLKNDVSVMLVDGEHELVIDATGKRYKGMVLHHVALTPNPQIPHLGPFVKIAASADEPERVVPVFSLEDAIPKTAAPSRRSYRMKPELAQQVRAKLGFGADVPDDQLDDKAAEKALALSAEMPAIITERDTLKSERDAAKDKVLSLSADLPKLPDPITLSMFAENISAKRESAIRSGALTEAEAKTFDGLLADAKGSPNALALSACGDDRKPFAFRFWDAVGKLAGGIRTGNAVPRDSSPASPLALSGDDKKDVVTPERMAELLAATPTGRAILADAAASAGKR